MSFAFILDAIGAGLEKPWLGIGRPMMDVITKPVREQLKAFYDRRLEKLKNDASDNDTTAVQTTGASDAVEDAVLPRGPAAASQQTHVSTK